MPMLPRDVSESIRRKGVRQTFCFQRIGRYLRLRYIDDAMNIKRDFLSRRAPMVVAEAVEVFAVVLGVEGVVARRDAAFVDLVGIVGVLDLWSAKVHKSAFSRIITSNKVW